MNRLSSINKLWIISYYKIIIYSHISHGSAISFFFLIIGENIILIFTFWSHSQFGPYILVAVNLVSVIFNL